MDDLTQYLKVTGYTELQSKSNMAATDFTVKKSCAAHDDKSTDEYYKPNVGRVSRAIFWCVRRTLRVLRV